VKTTISALWQIVLLGTVMTFEARAQVEPRAAYVYPAGGKQGSTVRVTVGGQFLTTVSNVCFSSEGLRGVVVQVDRPLTPKEFNLLRDELKALQEKRSSARRGRSGTNAPVVFSVADERRATEIREKIAGYGAKRMRSPALAETVILAVNIASETPVGVHELRLQSAQGISNPLVFQVSNLPETIEKAVDPPAPRRRTEVAGVQPGPPTRLTLPAVANGKILPGEVDRYVVSAHKGERITAILSARDLIPYLADAVPGWFQATLGVSDAAGHELAYVDDFRFNPDPVLSFEAPRDGDYTLEIKDSIYRGREDFVYRLKVGRLPYITGVFPLGGRAGEQLRCELTGWNLPTNRVVLYLDNSNLPLQRITVEAQGKLSNPMPIAVESWPNTTETEPNDTPQTATPITLPVVINGKVQAPNDMDSFQFQGKAGQVVVAEVRARRLLSPLDSTIRLTDASGGLLASNDDFEDKAAGLMTHHADSYLMVTLPTNGTYCIRLNDTQNHGGPDYSYRLRVSQPQPDFELRVTPSSLSARAGSCVPLTVYALRKDGFTNAIDMVLKGAPAGFRLDGGRIPASTDTVRVTLTVPSVSSTQVLPIAFEGQAETSQGMVIRAAVPAEDMQQAFSYHHLVPAQQLQMLVTPGRFTPAPMQVAGKSPVQIPCGGSAKVRFVGRRAAGDVQLQLVDPPEGVKISTARSVRDGTEVVLEADAALAKPGLKGNLILQASNNRSPAGKNKTNAARRPPGATLPAVPFEIMPR
jgi:hypothetical protein